MVPIAEGHALSIGIFSYRDTLGFGLYADPDAFPQVDDLPRTLDTSLRELLLPVDGPPARPAPRFYGRRGLSHIDLAGGSN